MKNDNQERRIEIESTREETMNQAHELIDNLKRDESMVIIVVGDVGERTQVQSAMSLNGSTVEQMLDALERSKEEILGRVIEEDPTFKARMELRELLKKLVDDL